jgi:hypothetical protein
MALNRVYPSDLRPPAPREMRREPPEPDADRAFEPVAAPGAPGTREKPAGETSPPPQTSEPKLDFPLPDPADAEDEARRPVVRYEDPLPIIMPLRYPVTIEGVGLVRQLAINDPTLWDIQDWAAGRLKTNYELMARMVGIDPVALGALRWPDVEALAAIVTTMLPEAMRDGIEKSKAAWARSNPR